MQFAEREESLRRGCGPPGLEPTRAASTPRVPWSSALHATPDRPRARGGRPSPPPEAVGLLRIVPVPGRGPGVQSEDECSDQHDPGSGRRDSPQQCDSTALPRRGCRSPRPPRRTRSRDALLGLVRDRPLLGDRLGRCRRRRLADTGRDDGEGPRPLERGGRLRPRLIAARARPPRRARETARGPATSCRWPVRGRGGSRARAPPPASCARGPAWRAGSRRSS